MAFNEGLIVENRLQLSQPNQTVYTVVMRDHLTPASKHLLLELPYVTCLISNKTSSPHLISTLINIHKNNNVLIILPLNVIHGKCLEGDDNAVFLNGLLMLGFTGNENCSSACTLT